MTTQDTRIRITARCAPLTPRDSRSLEVAIEFTNVSKQQVKIPLMAAGGPQGLFFDFVFLGSRRGFEVVSDGGGWVDPNVKPVKLVALAPGKTHQVVLRVPLPTLGQSESWSVVAVYRDHSYGHSPTYPEYGKKDPSVWRGSVVSNSTAISFAK